MSTNVAKIHDSIFGYSIQFWHLMYMWIVYPTLHVSLSNIIFNNNMIKIADIYGSTTQSLLHYIDINWCRKHSITLYVRSSLFKLQSNWNLQTRNICVIYVTRWYIYNPSIELSKGGSNIQHSIIAFYKKITVSQNNKCQVIFPAFMLLSLVFIYSFGAGCTKE